MIKNILVCILSLILMACSTPQKREEATEIQIVEPPVEVIEVLVEELKLPDGVSVRDTDRGKILVIDPSIIHFYKEKITMYEGYKNTFSLAKEVLDMNPSVNMILEGHASKPGKAYLYNYNLSVNRSKTSLNYLENIGISTNRLTIIGLGEGLPEYDTRALNRRLEFVIIENQDALTIYENFVKNVNIKEEMK